MKEFQQKRQWRRLLMSWPSIILLVLIAALVTSALFGVYKKSQEALSRRGSLQAEFEVLMQRKAYLEEEVQRLKTKIGIEEEIIDRFGVSKPGEEVLVIVEDEENENGSDQEGDKKSFWQTIFFWRD